MKAEALFLDFDGPVAALMPPPANTLAAAVAREEIAGQELPLEVEQSTDHLAVLRWARANCDDNLFRRVEHACTAAEVSAARICSPSPHAASLFDFARDRDIPVAMVSNNSEAAVRQFLLRWQWLGQVDTLACRTPETVDKLKPKPDLLQLAADALRVDATRAVFLGDSVSDVIASNAAAVPFIGLAKNDRRASELGEAGADLVTALRDPNALGLVPATGPD